MNIIDLYVNEVGEHLPEKMRADIEAEIRSLIEDTLEARGQAAGRAPDDDMVVEVLKEFGPPARMAASYLPPRYLIGPRLFPTFLMVLRIALTVVGIVALVRLGVAVSAPGLSGEAIGSAIAQILANLFTSAISVFGNIVIVFAIMDWALSKQPEKKVEWDPRSLKPRPAPDRIQPVALAWGIAFAFAAIVIFNVYPQWLGFWFVQSGQWKVYAMLTDAFFRYVPLMSAAWALQIVLSVMLLRAGRWQASTRWLQVGIQVLGLVILGLMIGGEPLIDLSATRSVLPPDAYRVLSQLATTGLRVLLIFIIIPTTVDLIKALVRIFDRKELPFVTE